MAEKLFTFGASVRGKAHARANMPNQDMFSTFVFGDVGGLVVADGLGSSTLADIASKAVCAATRNAMNLAMSAPAFNLRSFLQNIGFCLGQQLGLQNAPNYLSTCLWCFLPGDGKAYMGMLGDGLAAMLTRQGSVLKLSDDKSDSFSNIVTPLTPMTLPSAWQILSIDAEDLHGALLCSDGIADDLMDVDGFVREFLHHFGSKVAPKKAIVQMLEQWPVPMHSDDKTIACLVRRSKS